MMKRNWQRQYNYSEDGFVPLKTLFSRKVFFFALFFIGSFLAPSFPLSASTATLDFGWGSPFWFQKKGNKRYLAWPIQVSNSTKKRVFAQVDVVAVTDTGIQYAALAGLLIDNLVNVRNLSVLNNNIFPDVTQRAIVVFEAVDPKATLLHFYVGGVMKDSARLQEETQYFKVTYRRTQRGWKWDGSNTLE